MPKSQGDRSGQTKLSQETNYELNLENATEIAHGPDTAPTSKRRCTKAWITASRNQVQFEQMGQSTCFKSEDYKEGMKAFPREEKPVFKGK